MTTWKTYNKEKLDNTIEVKLFSNRVVSIWNIAGVTPLNNKGEEINTDEIGWFRPKKDWERYNKLQKHYNLLEQYDFDILDNFEFAIWDTYKNQEDKDEINELFNRLKLEIQRASHLIEKEAKTYLQ